MSKNLLTIEAFAEWAEKQPSEKEYDYWSYEHCACGQYAASLGISTLDWQNKLKEQCRDGDGFWWRANFEACAAATFGELAARLHSLSA